MKIPRKIKVGGHNYKIIKGHPFTEDYGTDGQIFHGSCVIKLASASYNQKMSHSRLGETFCHELMHAIDCTYNANKLNEATTNRLAEGLFQVLKDNDIRLYAPHKKGRE